MSLLENEVAGSVSEKGYLKFQVAFLVFSPLCRRQLLQSPQKNYRLNTDPNKLCADTRTERNRLRRQVEAFADSKMAEYAAAEAPKRGISAAELLRQTRAEEAARRARVDAAIRRIEGR